MSDTHPSWSLIELSAEAREAAERAALAAGMSLDDWLAQLIKYRSTMELREDARRRLQNAAPVAVPVSAPVDAAPLPLAVPAKPAAATPAPAAEPLPPALPGSIGARRPPRFGRDSRDAPGPEFRAEPRPESRPEAHAEPKPAAKPASAEPVDAAKPAGPPMAPSAAAPRRGDLPPPRMTPTDQLSPARLAALGAPREEEIQAALERWRGSGMLEPLIVRPRAGAPGQYEIVAGAERWHAARRAYVRAIPTIEYDCADAEAIELGLVDRLRRAPASPMVEANAYLRLMEDAGLPMERVARLAGKPAAHVGTMVRLLSLPKPVRDAIESGALSAAHARTLLEAPNPEAIAREVVDRRLDIFQTEQLVKLAKRQHGVAAETVPVEDVAEALAAEDEDGELALAAVEAVAAEAPAEALAETETRAVAEAGAGTLLVRRAPAPPRLPAEIGRAAAETAAEPPRRSPEPRPSEPRPTETRASNGDVVSTELLERKLAAATGLKAVVTERGGVGLVCLHYTTREELGRILARLAPGAADRREQG
jgi:ParB family transcriptional regulator, chromosome partitioning protein